jgi:hypothetical protein
MAFFEFRLLTCRIPSTAVVFLELQETVVGIMTPLTGI